MRVGLAQLTGHELYRIFYKTHNEKKFLTNNQIQRQILARQIIEMSPFELAEHKIHYIIDINTIPGNCAY